MVKICKKCNKEYSESHKFCNDCGYKLINKEEHINKHEAGHHSKNTKKVWILSIIVIILIISSIVIFAIPMPYTATEEYTEKEPYQDTEYYTDTQQYTDQQCTQNYITQNTKWGQTQRSCTDTQCTSFSQQCIQYNWLGNCVQYQSVCQSSKCTYYKDSCNLITKNLDSNGGTFSFDAYYKTNDGVVHFVQTESQYLQPGDEFSFVWYYSVDANNAGTCDTKNFVVPQKTNCQNVIKTRDVQKSRPVTKFRDVQKTRSVTRYATLFQQKTGQVKWYYKV